MEKAFLAHPLSPPKDTRFRRRMYFLRHLLKRAFLIPRDFSLATIGETKSGCAYTVCPDGLGPQSIIYSGGVGKDISFEHGLAKKFGCSIILFDPSPIGLATMKLPENQNPRFRFFPIGLAGQCGTLRLSPPFTPEGDSWFSADTGMIEVRCLDLATLMKENHHQHVDLIKIDIEGAEYGVIDQILEQRIPVRQILVEFHDGILPGIRLSQSLRSLFKLLAQGYKLVSEVGYVDTFVWNRAWPAPVRELAREPSLACAPVSSRRAPRHSIGNISLTPFPLLRILGFVGTETFYDQDYWTDGKHAGIEMPEPMFRKVLAPLISRHTVLDYGCGLGYSYQRQLVAAVRNYVGADVSSMAVADARRKGLEAAQVDATDGTVPLESSTFDGAVCSEVFEHLFDPLSAARELNRVLKPGGVLVATVPNFGYHTWRLLALLRAQVPLEPENPKEDRFKGVHIRFYSKLMFKRLLCAAGFVNIKIGSFDDASVWDIFKAMGHLGYISKFAHDYLPSFMHMRFLQDLWPNVFAMRLRAVAFKPDK